MLQYVAVCCGVLQCVAVCRSALSTHQPRMLGLICGKRTTSQCVAVCCSVLQCVAVRYGVLQCVAVCCSVLWWFAVCCSALSPNQPRMLGLICGKRPAWQCVECVAVCCSVL